MTTNQIQRGDTVQVLKADGSRRCYGQVQGFNNKGQAVVMTNAGSLITAANVVFFSRKGA
jgi:hypothetical protein